MSEGRRTPREYDPARAVVFRKTTAPFGGLSNMAAGFPLRVAGADARTAEALYQACRFPHRPDIQREVLGEASPMAAKARSRAHDADTRPDWHRARVDVMRWCLAVKLAQHFGRFGRLLESTAGRDIVEWSTRDVFWGARPEGGRLVGTNALGRLLMELRARYASDARYALLRVPAPALHPPLRLLGRAVEAVDERPAFLAALGRTWTSDPLPTSPSAPADLGLFTHGRHS